MSKKPLVIDIRPQGPLTKKKLKLKGIKSPDIKQRVYIGNGIYSVPKKKLGTKKEIDKYIKERRKILKLD